MTVSSATATPRFGFRQNNVVVLDGDNWLVQQRLPTGQWMLLQVDTGEGRFVHDDEVARLQRDAASTCTKPRRGTLWDRPRSHQW